MNLIFLLLLLVDLALILEYRQQYVRLQNVKTSFLISKTGLPQGSVLGPILFCLHINDLPTICTDTECQMYADDTVFYVSAKNPCQSAEILSRQMITVSEWLQRNHLTLNHKKMVSMCFSIRKKALEKFYITINSKEIDVVNEFKHLGITLVQGIHLWYSLPSEIKSQTELKTFSVKVKLWLKQQQKCEHKLLSSRCPYSTLFYV